MSGVPFDVEPAGRTLGQSGSPKASTPASPATPPQGIDLLWQEAHRVLDGQHGRVNNLDDKALPLLGFGLGGLAVLYTGAFVGAGLARDLAALLLGFGLFATLMAAYPRTVAQVPNFNDLVRQANSPPAVIEESYISNFQVALEKNEIALRLKVRWLKIAFASFSDALIIAIGTTVVMR